MEPLINDLRLSLSKLSRFTKKEENIQNDPMQLEMKDIAQEIISLTALIDNYIACSKIKKNPKLYEKLQKQQDIQKKVFKQFMPLIIAYDIMLHNE